MKKIEFKWLCRVSGVGLRRRWGVGGITLLLLVGFRANIASAQATQTTTPVQRPGQFPPPVEDTNRPAGITQNPTRPNSWSDTQGRSYTRSGVGTWTSYDESKANPYPLPDPLVLKNGQPVKDAETWWNQRRPEILEAFRTEIYGRIPENTPKVTWEVTATDTNAAGGIAMKKIVIGHIDNARYPRTNPSIHLTIYTPSKATEPAIGEKFGIAIPLSPATVHCCTPPAAKTRAPSG